MKIDENWLMLTKKFLISSERLEQYREIPHIFWTTWDVTYDNTKSHKEPRCILSLEDVLFEKVVEGEKLVLFM